MAAEQALLGAVLVNNEAMDRVSSFLEPQYFFEKGAAPAESGEDAPATDDSEPEKATK